MKKHHLISEASTKPSVLTTCNRHDEVEYVQYVMNELSPYVAWVYHECLWYPRFS